MSWLSRLMTSDVRSKADRAQDGPRRAQDTIELTQLDPSQTILEIEPGTGWFTGLLLELLNNSGTLIVQQPAALDGFFGKNARKRVERSGKDNARYSDASWETLDAQDASVDRVVWLQGPHELWFEPQPGISFGQPGRVFAEIARVLKPGGKIVLIDNLSPIGMDQPEAGSLHRSVPSALQSLAEHAGLRLVNEELEWITSFTDPLDVPTYDPKVHLKTSQFAQIYEK